MNIPIEQLSTDKKSHNQFCADYGIPIMSDTSWMLSKKHRIAHIYYWLLMNIGIPNVETEKIVADLTT